MGNMKEYRLFLSLVCDLFCKFGNALRHPSENEQMSRDHQQPVEEAWHAVRMPPGAYINASVVAFIFQREAQATQSWRFHPKQQRQLFFWLNDNNFPAINGIANL